MNRKRSAMQSLEYTKRQRTNSNTYTMYIYTHILLLNFTDERSICGDGEC